MKAPCHPTDAEVVNLLALEEEESRERPVKLGLR
jgi:hypothetical protein